MLPLGKFDLDPDHIGVIGRSAGGMLAAWMAMNTEGFDSEEWSGYSSNVQCAVDMFGPVDIPPCTKMNLKMVKTPGFRWSDISQTHEGCLLDLNNSMSEKMMMGIAKKASPVYYINKNASPLTIMHGDEDPLVPMSRSTDFYDRMVEAGLEHQTDLIILRHGGHGTREFFQTSTKKVIVEAFDKYLK